MSLLMLPLLLAGGNDVAAEETLTANQIESALKGKTIWGTFPTGNDFKTYHRADGKAFTKCCADSWRFRDSGKWWVKDNKLCTQWETTRHGEVGCSNVVREGSRLKIGRTKINEIKDGNADNL